MTRARVALLLVTLLLTAGCAGTLPGDLPTTEPAATDQPVGSDPAATGDEWTVTVTEVVDGDTLTVAFPDGHTEDVRLLGVDTPEVHVEIDPAEFEGVPESDAGRAWLRDWGHKASEFARTKLAGEEVRIAVDTEADRRGSYGRLLVYVFADGKLFNRLLLDQGYARVYESSFSKLSAFESVESTAMENDVGVWSYGSDGGDGSGGGTDGGTTTVAATSSTGLAVVTVHADAEGADGDNLNDEYVTFENRGDETLDLSGWTIRDEAGHSYTVPDGVTLDPGATMTLHTGSGTDSETDRYWDADSPIWNNGGDTVIVGDGTGSVVLQHEY